MIAIAAPLIFFYLLFRIARSLQTDVSAAILLAATAWGVVLTGLTELLSAFHLLSYAGVLGAWTISIAVCFCIPLKKSPPAPTERTNAQMRRLLAGVAGILLFTCFTGLISAPSNWDSMCYHLSRVMHWMHDHSVEHFPTNCPYQLYQGPWAEFAMLHFQLLSDGDRFAAGVACFSLAICVIGVAAIARVLGADRWGQVLSAVFAVSLPATVLQAESTQNNLALSAWLICAVYFLLRFKNAEPPNRAGWAILFGSAIGLAVLTKGTGYPMAFPLVVWFALVAIRSGASGVAIGALAAGMIVLLNLGHWTRNYRAFGSPLIPASQVHIYRPDAISPRLLASNLIRNLSLQLATPFASVNHGLRNMVVAAHGWLGVDILDPRITHSHEPFDVHPYDVMIHEDQAGNPLQTLLVAAAVVWAIRDRRALALTAAAIASFILFCATIKWQPYHTRLHLPIFMLAAAPVGMMLASSKIRTVAPWIGTILLLLTLPYLQRNPTHPWLVHHNVLQIPREKQYFLDNPTIFPAYSWAADELAAGGIDKIGLRAGPDEWEYPLWVLMHDRLGRWPDIERTDFSRVTAIVVVDPKLLGPIIQAEPYWHWQARTFGDLTVLINAHAPARQESSSIR